MTVIERWYVLQDSDGKPVRIWGDVQSAVREGFAAVAEGEDNLVEVVPASELKGAVEAFREFLAVSRDVTEIRNNEAAIRWSTARARALAALDAIEGQSEQRCTDCGESRPLSVIDCPNCDVPRGHVHGSRPLPRTDLRTEEDKDANR